MDLLLCTCTILINTEFNDLLKMLNCGKGVAMKSFKIELQQTKSILQLKKKKKKEDIKLNWYMFWHGYFVGLFSVSHTFTYICTYIIRSVRGEPSMVVLPRAPPSGGVPRSHTNTLVCYNWRRSNESSTTGSQKVGLCVINTHEDTLSRS